MNALKTDKSWFNRSHLTLYLASLHESKPFFEILDFATLIILHDMYNGPVK